MLSNIFSKTLANIESFIDWSGRTVSWLSLFLVLVTFIVVVLRYVFDSGAGQRPELKSQGPDPNDPADDIYAPALQAVFIDNSAKGTV